MGPAITPYPSSDLVMRSANGGQVFVSIVMARLPSFGTGPYSTSNQTRLSSTSMRELEAIMPTTSLTARSAVKRQSILSAGQQLFLEHGYRGTSMDQVAATASVSKQTVYKHFGEKRELLFTIVTDALDSAVGSIRDRIATLTGSADI